MRLLGLLTLLTASAPTPGPVQEAAHDLVTVLTFGGGGTGLPVSDRLVLTAAHVVGGSSQVSIELPDGERIAATVVASSVDDDLAVVQTKSVFDDPMELSTVSAPIGTIVYAIGDVPGGFGPQVEIGVIRNIEQRFGESYIRFTSAIAPGFSGGPVVDSTGAVVGVAQAKERSENGGLSVALDIADVRAFLGKPFKIESEPMGRPAGPDLRPFFALAMAALAVTWLIRSRPREPRVRLGRARAADERRIDG